MVRGLVVVVVCGRPELLRLKLTDLCVLLCARNRSVSFSQQVLREHFNVLRRGVHVHARVCTESMLPLHELIVDAMGKLEVEASKLGVTLDT